MERKRIQGSYPDEVVREKIRYFCNYRERCEQEVRLKLRKLGAQGDRTESMLSELRAEGFVNDERFARLFAGGKSRINKWGRVRISLELRKRGISGTTIDLGLGEIDEEAYRNTALKLGTAYLGRMKFKNPRERMPRMAAYLIRKGYEPELCRELSIRLAAHDGD